MSSIWKINRRAAEVTKVVREDVGWQHRVLCAHVGRSDATGPVRKRSSVCERGVTLPKFGQVAWARQSLCVHANNFN